MNHSSATLRRPVLLAIALVTALTMLAAWSASSRAAVICVPDAGVSPDCQTSFATIQPALDSAKNSGGNDEIRLGTGSFSGDLSYDNTTAGNTLDIIGSGQNPGQTVLNMVDTAGNNEGFHFTSVPGSTIRNLTYRIPIAADGSSDVGLNLNGVTADGIVVDGPTASQVRAIACSTCNVTGSTIDLPIENGTIGVDQTGGPAYVGDSVIKADYGVRHSSPGLTTTVERSRITAHTGASTDGGNLEIFNTLILLDDQPNAVGINLYNPNEGTYAIGATLDHLTIISGGGQHSIGIRAIADSESSGEGESVDATLTNSVIHGFNGTGEHTLDLLADKGRTVTFHSSYSAYDNARTSNVTGSEGGTVDYELSPGHLDLEGGVSFVDPQSGDYTPSLLGGLLDGGDPIGPLTGITDINGNPRACHGTDEGIIRQDIGAFEARTVVSSEPDDCTYPVTSILAKPPASTTAKTASFTLGTDKNPGTFLCSLDGGPESDCGYTFETPTLSVGDHSLSVRAKDQFGNIDQSPETYSWSVKDSGPGPCETNCVDKTAPKVIGVKAPKQTRAATVKVRFKSNEKGSTFKCRLNKGKWKSCKSPWKTPRLRKGKNTVSIRAIDKAGNRSKVVTRVIRKVSKAKKRR
ncbi:MAG TPA: hypothetical protein PLE13_02960 [Solirubrobacterales bacterium]|nr:hypothetical protein [Solirubrobacterales bacterium]